MIKMNNEKVKFLLNWNHFTDHLSTCMTKLMTDISYSDIIIATADKHMIYSHRFVLANSSKYFQRLLKNVKSQREIQLVVALPEIKYDIFKILMNYMYKGETQVPHELLPSVIKAGQFLEIIGLVNMSEGGDGGTGTGSNASLFKYSSTGGSNETSSRSSSAISGPSNGGNSAEPKKVTVTLRDKIHSRENVGHGSKEMAAFRCEKRTRGEKPRPRDSSPQVVAGENGKENRGTKIISKMPKSRGPPPENVDYIQLPLKRKAFTRDAARKAAASGSSSSTVTPESSPPKKNLRRLMTMPEMIPIKIKTEKHINEESSSSPPPPPPPPPPLPPSSSETNNDEITDVEEKITIKVEEPDEIEEVEYNELQCEFCHEVYTNPSDWVKHMTEQHEDRGYQTYKDQEKTAGSSTVITCVVCSCVCYSATEWANHLKMWHTDRELAVANMSVTKKSSSKVKKKGSSKK